MVDGLVGSGVKDSDFNVTIRLLYILMEVFTSRYLIHAISLAKKKPGFHRASLVAYFQDLFLCRIEPDRNNDFAFDRLATLRPGFPVWHICKHSHGCFVENVVG